MMLCIYISGYAQLIQGFNYQAVAREADGTPKTGNVDIRFVIHQNTPNGGAVLDETHNGVPVNAFGLFTAVIGSQNAGGFANIDWAEGPYFLEVRVDGQQLGPITRFQAVPYSMLATDMNLEDLQNVEKVPGAIPVEGQVLKWNGNIWAPGEDRVGTGQGGDYTPGDGISIDGTVISNTKPDVEVKLTGEGGTTVTGTYPEFTISSPIDGGTGEAVTIEGEGTINVAGTHPNFTISSTDPDEDKTNEFQNLAIDGNTLSITDGNSVELPTGNGNGDSPWVINGNKIYYNDGNVGIGDNDPNYKLSIKGGDDNNGTTASLYIESQGNQRMLLDGNEIDAMKDGLIINNNSRGPIYVAEHDNRLAVGRFLAYGTNTDAGKPQFQLHLRHPNTGLFNGLGIQNDGDQDNDWNLHVSSTDQALVFVNKGNWKRRFLPDGSIVANSDRRLKQHIVRPVNILSQILSLQPSIYEMIDRPGEKQWGFIAQEVEEIFPEFVKYVQQEDAYMMDYEKFGVLAIQAVKEQQQQMNKRDAKIEELEGLVHTLSDKIHDLEQQLKEK